MTTTPLTNVADEHIFIVDDEAPVRDALSFLFSSHGFQVQACDGGPALLQALQLGTPPCGCILLDVRMEPMSGLQLFDELQASAVPLPVIFLSGHGDIAMAVEALKQGAFDFIEKPFGDEVLVARVRAALRFCQEQKNQSSQNHAFASKLAQLTERERQLMRRVAAGKLNKVIADEMHIAVRTVEVHRSRVFAKLGVRSAAELATVLAKYEDSPETVAPRRNHGAEFSFSGTS